MSGGPGRLCPSAASRMTSNVVFTSKVLIRKVDRGGLPEINFLDVVPEGARREIKGSAFVRRL
jgi:hypothetical protein